jgi:hypothetical protein
VDAQDLRRGRLPKIVSDDGAITFVLTISAGVNVAWKLVLKCEPDGSIYASIDRT